MLDEIENNELDQGTNPDLATTTQADSGDLSGEPESVDSATTEEQKKPGLEQRFSELTGQIKDLKEQNAYFRGQIDALGKQPQQPEQQEVVVEVPDRDAYDTEQEYNLAVELHGLKQDFGSLKSTIETTSQAQETESRFQTMERSYSDARKKHEDFDSVINGPNMHITQDILNAAMGDNVGELIYHLQKNPAEAMKLQRLSGIGLAKEVGRLEAKLTFKPEKKTTQAGKIPETVGSNTSTEVPLENKSLHEKFTQWGKQEKKDWRP